MSFRVQKSDKFADQFPVAKKSSTVGSDLLSSEDYILFNLGEKPTGGAAAAAQSKPKKGGMSIRRVNSAQADYY